MEEGEGSPSSTAPQLGHSFRYFESLAAKEQRRVAVAARNNNFVVINDANTIPSHSNHPTGIRPSTYGAKILKWAQRLVTSVKTGMRMGLCSWGAHVTTGSDGRIQSVADPLRHVPISLDIPQPPVSRNIQSLSSNNIVAYQHIRSEKSRWTDPLIVANKAQLFQLFSRYLTDNSGNIHLSGLREMLSDYRICPALCSSREIEGLVQDVKRTSDDSPSSDGRRHSSAMAAGDTATPHLDFVGFIDVLWLIASHFIFVHPPQQQHEQGGSDYDRVRLAMLLHLFEVGGSGATGVVFDLGVLREARANAASRRRIDCEEIPRGTARAIDPEQKFLKELSTGIGMSVSDETSSSVAKY